MLIFTQHLVAKLRAAFIVFSVCKISTMAPKTKKKTPSSTQKREGTAKSRKSQPPQLFPTPHREADSGRDDDELMLKDVMMGFESINSRLAAHDTRLSAPEVPPPWLLMSNYLGLVMPP